jgi:hypothetical protein
MLDWGRGGMPAARWNHNTWVEVGSKLGLRLCAVPVASHYREHRQKRVRVRRREIVSFHVCQCPVCRGGCRRCVCLGRLPPSPHVLVLAVFRL